MTTIARQHHRLQPYFFKWPNYHSHLGSLAYKLREDDCMVDVTLSVDGERIYAHRIVLSVCSTFFQDIFREATEDHPTIIISDIAPQDVRLIVEYAYHGEVRVPVENINNLLEAARALKICGLMEVKVECLNEDVVIATKDELNDNDVNMQEDSNQADDKTWLDNAEKTEDASGDLSIIAEHNNDAEHDNEPAIPQKKKRRRREGVVTKNYSQEMLDAAIDDLRAGQSLADAANKNHVPRSTVYMRAKALGVQINATRSDYPAECVKAAIDAVINGSSFSRAADMYGIPKTVIWRRIQKEGYQILRSDIKRSYDSEKREAAIKAIERGENLTKVALEFKIPKTTLFRDKMRLVDEGKLPQSFWKRRSDEDRVLKRLRIEAAATACKEGKMSHGAAAEVYRVPKTSIWRRLHQENVGLPKRKNESAKKLKKTLDPANVDEQLKCDENLEFSVCEVSSEMTYINDDNSIPEDSVIILTTEEVEALDFDENRQIIVSSTELH